MTARHWAMVAFALSIATVWLEFDALIVGLSPHPPRSWGRGFFLALPWYLSVGIMYRVITTATWRDHLLYTAPAALLDLIAVVMFLVALGIIVR